MFAWGTWPTWQLSISRFSTQTHYLAIRDMCTAISRVNFDSCSKLEPSSKLVQPLLKTPQGSGQYSYWTSSIHFSKGWQIDNILQVTESSCININIYISIQKNQFFLRIPYSIKPLEMNNKRNRHSYQQNRRHSSHWPINHQPFLFGRGPRFPRYKRPNPPWRQKHKSH